MSRKSPPRPPSERTVASAQLELQNLESLEGPLPEETLKRLMSRHTRVLHEVPEVGRRILALWERATDRTLQRYLVRLLERLGEARAPEALPLLLRELHSSESEVREAVLAALSHFPSGASRIVPLVLERMQEAWQAGRPEKWREARLAEHVLLTLQAQLSPEERGRFQEAVAGSAPYRSPELFHLMNPWFAEHPEVARWIDEQAEFPGVSHRGAGMEFLWEGPLGELPAPLAWSLARRWSREHPERARTLLAPVLERADVEVPAEEMREILAHPLAEVRMLGIRAMARLTRGDAGGGGEEDKVGWSRRDPSPARSR